MSFNFDEPVNRKGTNSIKYDFAEQMGMGYNCEPLWIADMDFRAPDAVCDCIRARAEHGVFGYSSPDGSYFASVEQWFRARHNWQTEPRWLVITEGMLPAISTAIHILTNPGDNILLQTPSYSQFTMLIEFGRRNVVKSPLVLEGEKYRIDFADFERAITRNKVKLFILCSPHNPIGRVWTADELKQIGDICVKYGVKVISDEIFADLTLPGYKHTVFASLNNDFLDNTVTCTAPTKTFNISGMPISNIFIANDDLREDFEEEYKARGNLGISILPFLAAQAAYQNGAEWLDALRDYLADNVAYARKFIKEKLPEIIWTEPEGTYLLWLDFRKLGFWAKELEAFLADEAKVILANEPGAEGFLRVNLATRRARVVKAFEQIETAAKKVRVNI